MNIIFLLYSHFNPLLDTPTEYKATCMAQRLYMSLISFYQLLKGFRLSQVCYLYYLSYARLSTQCTKFLTSVSAIPEPNSYKERYHDRRWIVAMQQDIQALESKCT